MNNPIDIVWWAIFLGPVAYVVVVAARAWHRAKDGHCAVCGQKMHFVARRPVDQMYSSYVTIYKCDNGHLARTGDRRAAEW